MKKEKTIIKFGDIEIQKQRFHWHNRLISIKRSKKVCFGKKGLKYLIGYRDAKKIDLDVYFSQEGVHIEKTLMKLNIYRFW